MLDNANSVETPDTTVDAPESLPAEGSVSPSSAEVSEAVSAQGQGVSQPPPSIPKWRFDEVNQRYHALQQQVDELRSQKQAPQNQPSEPQAPQQEDFPTYEAWIRADARFVAEQAADQRLTAREQKQQQEAEQRAQQSRVQSAETNWSQKAYEASAKYQDFQEKLATAPPLTNAHAAAVMKASPVAGDLAYHLANNPATVTRLNGMHPIDAAMELGRIEARLSAPAGQPAARKPSASIPALDPVGAGKTPGLKHADQMTSEDVLKRLYPHK